MDRDRTAGFAVTVDEAVARAAAALEDASIEPNPDVARLKGEQAEVWLRMAELLNERDRV